MTNRYLSRTAMQLIDAYCFEHGRINEEDRKVTQDLIEKELRRRFETMLMLMAEPDLADHPEQLYEYFTHEYGKK